MLPKLGFSIYERCKWNGYERFDISFSHKSDAFLYAEYQSKGLVPKWNDKTGFKWEIVVKNDHTNRTIKVFR